MITRLQIDGFKNLVDMDIHFGKFNVITGANGVGKSNLFDAIYFLSNLAQMNLLEATKKIRNSERDYKNLFSYQKSTDEDAGMSVRCYFDLQHATSLHYNLYIRSNQLRIESEHLNQPPHKNFFTTTAGHAWYGDQHKQTETDFRINTFLFLMHTNPDMPAIKESRKEIISWKILNFTPQYIRLPDTLSEEGRLGEQGEHIPSVLHRIKNSPVSTLHNQEDPLSLLSNRLFELTGEIKRIRVQRIEAIESIWVEFQDPDGTWHNARALSDGTLRFLALAVLWLDPEAKGVFCIEEPENGIHPSKIPALMRLLRDISEKPDCQVIVNTHSPALVAQTPAEDIIVAYPVQRAEPDGRCYTVPRFAGLRGTWREEAGMHVATISQVMDYLDPIPQRYVDEPLRLLDREDARRLLERRRERTWEVTED
jgi:predicted ATPase